MTDKVLFSHLHNALQNYFGEIEESGRSLCKASLTTDCVGIPLTSNQIDAIHKGQLDFRNGHCVFEREFFSQLEQI